MYSQAEFSSEAYRQIRGFEGWQTARLERMHVLGSIGHYVPAPPEPPEVSAGGRMTGDVSSIQEFLTSAVRGRQGNRSEITTQVIMVDNILTTVTTERRGSDTVTLPPD